MLLSSKKGFLCSIMICGLLIACGGGGEDSTGVDSTEDNNQSTQRAATRAQLDGLWQLSNTSVNRSLVSAVGLELDNLHLLAIENLAAETADIFMCSYSTTTNTLESINDHYMMTEPPELAALDPTIVPNDSSYAIEITLNDTVITLPAESVLTQDESFLFEILGSDLIPADNSLICGHAIEDSKTGALQIFIASALDSAILLTELEYPSGLLETASVGTQDVTLTFSSDELTDFYSGASLQPNTGQVTVTECTDDSITLVINTKTDQDEPIDSLQRFNHNGSMTCDMQNTL